MNLQEYYESIDLAEIERFITDEQEENLHLEFKTVNHPNYNSSNREFDKKNISEAISGFANSDGGIIIWGIETGNSKKQDVASKKKPIKELTKFLNALNRLEGEVITPIVTGVLHKKIEICQNEGFIKTFVPPSDFAPHMANYSSSKHYYKRSGDSFRICEHYDIRDMFQRKVSAKLDFIIKDKAKVGSIGNKTRYDIILTIINTGRGFAKSPLLKVEINAPYFFSDFGIDGNGYIGLFKTRAAPRTPQLSIYSGGQDVIIYAGFLYDIDIIRIEVPSQITILPDLVLKYVIVAENMDKFENIQTIKIE